GVVCGLGTAITEPFEQPCAPTTTAAATVAMASAGSRAAGEKTDIPVDPFSRRISTPGDEGLRFRRHRLVRHFTIDRIADHARTIDEKRARHADHMKYGPDFVS